MPIGNIYVCNNFDFQIHAIKIFEHEKALFSNGSIDIEAEKSSLRRHVEDQEWLSLYEYALPICNQFSEDNCGTIQSMQKRFTKDQCNVKYIWTLWCMTIYGFAVSFFTGEIWKMMRTTNMIFNHETELPRKFFQQYGNMQSE